MEAFKFVWCWLFHKRWRSRTGNRRIGNVSISYDVLCAKCGNTDIEIEIPQFRI